MTTITINYAGKRKSAYKTEKVSTNVYLNGQKKTKLSVKEAEELTKNLNVYHEGVLYKTWKLN